MTRGGRKDEEAEGPERRCIALGEVRPVAELIRFVASPDGAVVPDLAGKLPGRGIWVSPDRAALEKACKKGLFSRAAKTALSVPEDLVDLVEAGLVARVTGGIGLARKAGLAVCGFEKVKSFLATQRTGALLQASDGSVRGKGKLWTPTGARFIGCLSSQELGLAFGRQAVIHAALGSGALARRVVEDAAKLRRVRPSDPGEATSE